MIEDIRQTILTSDFIFILILLGFILVVTLLLLENRRDNIRLKQINQKVKDLIAGDYSRVLDMQGSSEITNITNNLNDLSEVIRLTQENLEQETKRLNSILSYMTDGVLATNRRGQITMINDMAKKQLGIVKEEALNKSILELLKIEDEYELRDLITQIPELMIDSQNANGEYLSLRVRFALIRRESGFISGLVAVLHDTTEQEKEERERRLFVSNVSHELRTPLAVLQNRLETLFRKPEATIMESSENIASSLEEVRNMRMLTTNLLNLARRDDGIKAEIADVEPEFFTTTFANYEIIADENEKVFVFENHINHNIKTDRTLLKQLMTILFDNAVKYTEEDGIIKFIVWSKDRSLYLRVSDNGPGINNEDKKKIFDRFYRVDKARTRQKGGFGLGLSLAKQIADALKGTITVKDNRPKGTIFEVKISIKSESKKRVGRLSDGKKD